VGGATHTQRIFPRFLHIVLQYNDEDEDDQIAKNARDAALAIAQGAYARVPNKWSSPRVATMAGWGPSDVEIGREGIASCVPRGCATDAVPVCGAREKALDDQKLYRGDALQPV